MFIYINFQFSKLIWSKQIFFLRFKIEKHVTLTTYMPSNIVLTIDGKKESIVSIVLVFNLGIKLLSQSENLANKQKYTD